jgi:sigma-E factor negative regulatory protein RseB
VRLLGLLAALLTALVGVSTAPPTGRAAGDSVLDQARLAAEVTPFEGTVLVQWVDSFGVHAMTLSVKDTAGAVQIEGQGHRAIVATSNERLVLEAGGWSLVAPGSPTAYGPEPALASKYQVRSSNGPLVADRPTTLVDIHTADGSSEERLFVDQGTGLLLRREQQEAGRTVRVVSFESIQIGPVAGLRTPSAQKDERPHQLAPNALPAPYRAPQTLASGYQRVGVLRSHGVVQVVYSDGLHSLSVFEQTGQLDVGDLPRPAEAVAMGRAKALRYSWPGGDVVTWQSGSATFTVVGDGPEPDVLAAARSLPRARSLSSLQRFRSACRRLVEELTGADSS